MLNLNKTIGTIFILTFLLSCGNDKSANHVVNPKAFQDKKVSLKTYSRSGDITEELYAELVSNNAALQKLEAELEAYSPKEDEVRGKFDNYDDKSTSYYRSVNEKSSGIKDSLLRQKMDEIIALSTVKYEGKTAQLKSLMSQILNNRSSINDHHAILKIVLTLPMMEEYQKNNKPTKNEFENLINQQNKLIFRIDSLTPQY